MGAALQGDFRALAMLERELAELGKPSSRIRALVAREAVAQGRALLKEQFSLGTDPAGARWELTKRGRPALVSKKLPKTLVGRPRGDGVEFFFRVPWLRAHHEGHTFPARKQALVFDKKGRIVKRFAKLKKGQFGPLAINRRAFVEQDARIGSRVLPQRRIHPEGDVPDRWGKALNRAGQVGLAALREKTGAG